MNLLKETDKAYLAGFLDGEGYIGIVRQKKTANKQQSDSWLYHPWVILTSTDQEVLKDLQLLVSVGKMALQRRTAGHKDVQQLKITNHADVVNFLSEIKPFLKIKKKQAEILINYCLDRKSKKVITGRGSRGHSSFDINDEQYYLKLKVLNKKGK